MSQKQPTSPRDTDISSFMSRTSTNASKSPVVLNKLSPQVIANEHHKHHCCNGRYHCDGSKCPNGPIVNPAIGVPLAICTAGLSQAAFGMYRGIRDHRARKKIQAACREEQTRQENLDSAQALATEAVRPSSIALSDGASQKAFEAGTPTKLVEMGGTPTSLKGRHMLDASPTSELGDTSIAPPPSYAVELDSSEIKSVEKSAN